MGGSAQKVGQIGLYASVVTLASRCWNAPDRPAGIPAPRAAAPAGDPCRGRQLDSANIDEVGFSPAAGCTWARVHESTGLGAPAAAPRLEPAHSRTPLPRI